MQVCEVRVEAHIWHRVMSTARLMKLEQEPSAQFLVDVFRAKKSQFGRVQMSSVLLTPFAFIIVGKVCCCSDMRKQITAVQNVLDKH